MKKWLTYLALLTGLAVVMLLLAYWLARRYEPEVRNIVTYELNRHLAAPVQVADINLSLLQRFPYASLRFSQVVIPAVRQGEVSSDTLIYIDNLYLQIGLFDFLRQHYRVSEAELKGGFMRMATYADGTDNYHFWKSGGDSTAQASLSLEAITLRDFKYRLSSYDDLELVVDASDVRLEGNFGEQRYTLHAESVLQVVHVSSGGKAYYRDTHLEGELSLDVDLASARFSFSSEGLEIAEVPYGLQGSYAPRRAEHPWQIKLSGSEVPLNDLLAVVPLEYRKSLAAYEVLGRTNLSVSLAAGSELELQVAFDHLEARLRHLQELGRARVHEAAGLLEVKGGFTTLHLDKMRSSIGPGELSAWGRIVNLQRPSFDLHIQGGLSLEALKEFVPMPLVAQLQGEVRLDGRLQGALHSSTDDATVALLRGIDFTGTIALEEGALKMVNQGQEYRNISGALSIRDNAVAVERLQAEVNGQSFELRGRIDNALPYLASDGERLHVEAQFSADELDLNQILDQSESRRDTSYRLIMPATISFDLGLEVGKLSFRKFEAKGLSGKVYYKNNLLTVNPVAFALASGQVQGRLAVEATSATRYEVRAAVEMESIALEELFSSFENFGQEVIRAEHLKGRAHAEVAFSAVMNERLKIDAGSVRSEIKLRVEEGSLIDVEALDAVSAYLRENVLWRSLVDVHSLERKLRKVEFEGLENTLTIADQVIHIPDMQLRTSAMKLNISGKHYFDNRIDYSFDFKLSELMKKREVEESEFGYVVDEGDGMRLFLKMGGTVANPEFSLDKAGAREQRREQLAREKQVLKGMLKEEFGLFGKDSTVVATGAEVPQDRTRFEVDWEGFKHDNDTAQEGRAKRRSKKGQEELYEDEDL